MKILTKEKLSNNRYLTDEGYLVCIEAILARTGFQKYSKNELFQDGDEEIVEVFRASEEVFNEKTIASFENKPITIEHPEQFVNVENYKDFSVGFVRDVQKATIDNQDVLVGNLIITDKNAIELINQGMEFLSCGYECEISEENGQYKQKVIRGNHVALCRNPRAEITKIQDSKEQQAKTLIVKSISKIQEVLNNIDNFTNDKIAVIDEMLTQMKNNIEREEE